MREKYTKKVLLFPKLKLDTSFEENAMVIFLITVAIIFVYFSSGIILKKGALSSILHEENISFYIFLT